VQNYKGYNIRQRCVDVEQSSYSFTLNNKHFQASCKFAIFKIKIVVAEPSVKPV